MAVAHVSPGKGGQETSPGRQARQTILFFLCSAAFIEGMSACHTKPFILPGILVDVATSSDDRHSATTAETCDYCGSARIEWRKCKLICVDCRQINKSCADL